ncbi:MAG TPA: hypothetical protein ENJ35_05395 [Gammaproteobacteria bacterium]|nr:hypothetical protein [Gammaproteobacteria bacterium]
MKQLTHMGFVAITILLMASCASLPLSGPKRPAYTGKDTVTAVNPSAFIGTWRVKILNPTEGEKHPKLTYTYKPGGTVMMISDNRNTGNPMSDMVLEMTGSWKIHNGIITQKLVSVRETSGNKFAGIVVGVMNSFKNKLSGDANVYTLEPNRIVLVSEDSQHEAQELTRVR